MENLNIHQYSYNQTKRNLDKSSAPIFLLPRSDKLLRANGPRPNAYDRFVLDSICFWNFKKLNTACQCFFVFDTTS